MELNLFAPDSDVVFAAWIPYLLLFIVGACIGSFLNVVIYRVPNERSLFPGSACPSCSTPIKPWHNVPILGWLMLGGKCASCSAKISPRYPLIELATGLLFCLCAWQVGWNPYLPVALAFVSAIIALIFIDADHMILPNVITYPMFVIALIIRVAFPLMFEGSYFSDMTHAPISFLQTHHAWPMWAVSLAGALFGALIGGGSLWLVGAIWKALRGVDAMGLGDVKLLLGIGALLGWRLTLLTIFLGAFTGALAGIVLISRQKDRNLQTQIPFGIFLGVGAIISILVGDRILEWYLSQFA